MPVVGFIRSTSLAEGTYLDDRIPTGPEGKKVSSKVKTSRSRRAIPLIARSVQMEE
jgi:hypothetical protein